MSFRAASKQFDENRKLFSDPENRPHEYNLNAGLGNITSGLSELEVRVVRIEQQLDLIVRLLQSRG